MRITHIQSTGLKGQDIDLDLDPVSVSIGPNASGKSAVMDALLLGVLGYRPGWGKTAEDTLMASSGRIDISITVAVDPELPPVIITRTWERLYYKRGERKGDFKKVVRRVDCSLEPSTSHQKTHEQAVRTLFGLSSDKTQRADQEQCFDVASFLGLSHDKRRVALFRIAHGLLDREWTPERMVEELKAANVWSELLIGRPDVRDVADGPIEWLERAWKEKVSMLSDARRIRREAEAGVAAIDEERSDESKVADPAAVGLLKASVEDCSASEVAAMARHTEAIAECTAALGKAKQANADIVAARIRVDDIQGQLAELRGPLPEDAAGLAHKIAEIEAPFGANSLSTMRSISDHAKEAAEAPMDRSSLSPISGVIEQLELEVEALRADLGALNADAKKGKALASDITTLSQGGSGHCPLCRQVVGRASLSALHNALVPLNEAFDKADEVRDAVVTKEADLGEARTLRERMEDHLLATQAQRSADYRDAVDDVRALEQRLVSHRRQLRALQSESVNPEQIGRLESLLETVTEVASREVESLENLSMVLEGACSERDEEMEKLTGATVAAQMALVEGTRHLERHRVWMSMRAKAAELEEQEEQLREIVDALGPRGILGKVAATVLGPFKDVVNSLLRDLGLGEFSIDVFDERDRPVLRMGIKRDGELAPVETLSGGESTAVRAGMSLALATVSELPWRPLLIDEVEGVDEQRQAGLRAAVDAAIEQETASQAMILGCWGVL